jgi:hypothetical protein
MGSRGSRGGGLGGGPGRSFGNGYPNLSKNGGYDRWCFECGGVIKGQAHEKTRKLYKT